MMSRIITYDATMGNGVHLRRHLMIGTSGMETHLDRHLINGIRTIRNLNQRGKDVIERTAVLAHHGTVHHRMEDITASRQGVNDIDRDRKSVV